MRKKALPSGRAFFMIIGSKKLLRQVSTAGQTGQILMVDQHHIHTSQNWKCRSALQVRPVNSKLIFNSILN